MFDPGTAAIEVPPCLLCQNAVWPGHDWSESVLLTRLTSCPTCSDEATGGTECVSTGLVTAVRRQLLTIEILAAYAYDAA